MIREIRYQNRKENWYGSKWIRKDKRLAILIRDGFVCAYCGVTVEDGASLTLDHLTPQCYCTKANNHESNLITCCSNCNSKRANMSVVQFVRQLHNDEIIVCQNVARINKLRKESLSSYRQTAKTMLAKRSVREFTGN